MSNAHRTKAAVAAAIACLVGALAWASSSAADEFTAETAGPITFTATNPAIAPPDGTIAITAGTTTCDDIDYTRTVQTMPRRIIRPDVALTKCKSFGFPSEAAMNECGFAFNIASGTSTAGTLDVDCPSGKEITVVALSAGTAKCTMHIPPQTGLSGVTYQNTGSGTTREVLITVNAGGLKYTHTAGSGLGQCTGGSGTTGTVQLIALATAEKDEKGNPPHIGFFVS